MKENIAPIEELDVRDLFRHEAGDFTPWLVEHLDQLSERLGIEIGEPETEAQVGNFKLDILALDTNSKEIVAIENQLGPSDHTHLGQLLTYASGVEAGIVAWITSELRLEHQQALTWLNENSETSFFGVELRAIRIGESNPAIDFRVKVAPNDWQRGVRRSTRTGEVSPRNELYRNFFTDLADRYFEMHPGRRQPKAQPQSWYAFGAGKSGIIFGWAFKLEKKFSVEVYLDAGDADLNKNYMDQLMVAVTPVQDELQDLSWEELPHARACRIALYTDGAIDHVSSDPSDRERLIVWATKYMRLMEGTFRKPIGKLKA